MNAQKAFEKTNQVNQGSLLDVKKTIAQTTESGYYSTHYSRSLSKTDIKTLRDEGYRVIDKPPPSGYAYYFEISWQYVKS